MKEKKLAIVILNYLNYTDTIECIESVLDMNYNIEGIVVVDNASTNESYTVLKRKYKHNEMVHILKAGKNYGFAKGNNIGIRYARTRLGADYVFVTNNDTVFIEQDYFDKLYQYTAENIAVMGSRIKLRDGKYQGLSSVNISYGNLLLQFLIDSFLSFGCSGLLVEILEKWKKKPDVQILHGCALLFTPIFFEHYEGFYPNTFLYHEEEILYLMCQKYGLKQRFVKDALIFHKEDCSSEMSFNNNSKVLRKYSRNSLLHVFFVKLQNDKSRRNCK